MYAKCYVLSMLDNYLEGETVGNVLLFDRKFKKFTFLD